MKIETSWISKNTGEKIRAYYEEADDFAKLPKEKIKSVCAFCYLDRKFVLVKNQGKWQPVAGHIEVGETPEEALIREIKEESNMKVLKYFPIGYLYTYGEGEHFYQTRYLCLVEPCGPFTADPDGEVTEIKLATPDDLPKLIDWKDTANLMVNKCLDLISKIS